MNIDYKSYVLGLVLAAIAGGATAAGAPEMGCAASQYRDAPSEPAAPDSLVASASIEAARGSYWRDDSVRPGPADSYNGVRVLRSSAVKASSEADHRPPALERISSRVERLGQGIAATPLVQGLIYDSRSGSDPAGQPKLITLLLAAVGVVGFVARRRRAI